MVAVPVVVVVVCAGVVLVPYSTSYNEAPDVVKVTVAVVAPTEGTAKLEMGKQEGAADTYNV